MKNRILFLLLLAYNFGTAQQDSIVKLKEVVLTDVQLKEFSDNVNKIQFNDSVISLSGSNLTDILNLNSSIYFKENGKGMVSSPSFRGTTAQQTAVVWNGININSQLNGQTDFNTINASDFNTITVRSGGGSVIYGSGAIGGTIHLNNDVSFLNQSQNVLSASYGSFNTLNLNYGFLKSTKKLIAKFSITRNQSENDYPYVGYDKKNENGNYENLSFNSVFGYKISKHNAVKLFSYFYNGERFFSGTISSPSKSKYENFNTRNLLEWQNTAISKLTSKTKIAYFSESYKYFENKEVSDFSEGAAYTFIGRQDFLYKMSSKFKMNAIAEINQTKGEGTSLENASRTITSFSFLAAHQLFNTLSYEASLRKESTSQYESPLLYSFGVKYSPFKVYSIRATISKNFRIPTFNDLYWQGAGNLDLKPETSFQYEISQDLKIKNLNFTVTAFKNELTDMLRWLPGNSGVWRPTNTENVSITGIETLGNWYKQLHNWSISVNATYTYTKSINEEISKQLIYVPYHKFTSSLGLQYKSLGFVYNYMFNGAVFTSSDNKNTLPEFGLSNVTLRYKLPFLKTSIFSFQVLNVENKPYQNVLSRPMPGRNYMFNLNFKF